MKQIFLSLIVSMICLPIFAQPGYTANDQTPTYDKQFLPGINPGYNGNNWTDKKLADLSYGNPDVGVEGIGMKTFRIPLPESFLDYWGYEILLDAFQHYEDLGMCDLTVFLQSPSPEHLDPVQYCPGEQSQMWANLYLPIWDNGENGTPVNDENYAALYIYKTVSLYKDNVRFWEILNEPDFGWDNCGWKPAGMPGNWFDSTPGPCLTLLKTPVYHYIRLLKVAYEVIKTLDEDAFVAVGGIGFEGYLDVLLRHTDNPVDGSVTAEYPLTGGAYFDMLSFHSYPHFNGTLLYQDTTTFEYLPQRHSDAAADGIVDHKSRFEAVLDNYGYDGNTFPKKTVIITETGMPSKQLETWIGSPEAQRNYVMKVQIAAYQNDIRQIDFYNLANQAPYDQATSWLEVMGMLEQISDQQPYDITVNQSGIGCRTLTRMIGEGFYDAAQTALLQLPNEVKGAAFDMGNNEFRYVLWAATTVDQSEEASFEYTFPASLNFNGMNIREWDHSVTNETEMLMSNSITLSGNPKFIDLFNEVNTTEVSFLENVNVLPNPFVDVFEIQFSLLEKTDLEIELVDTQGKILKTIAQKDLLQGEQKIRIEASEIPSGVYFGKIRSQGKLGNVFKLVKI